MTVAELIELLSKLDSNATVAFSDGLSLQTVTASDGYVYLCDLNEDEIEEIETAGWSRQQEEDVFFPDDYATID